MSPIKRNRQAYCFGDKIDEIHKLVIGEPQVQIECDEINPFLLNPVLKMMMSKMSIEDLKMSRGVSQLWDQHSTNELQKLTNQMKTQELTKPCQIKNFSNSLQESCNKDFICNKMKINLQALLSTEEERFFQTFQPKSLEIDVKRDPNFSLGLELFKILQNCSANIENLRVIGFILLHRSEFDEPFDWPENLNFPQLECIQVDDFVSDFVGIEEVHFIIQHVIKNARKLKSLKLSSQPSNHLLCDQFKSCDLIEKLQNLEINYYNGSSYEYVPIFTHDLLEMAQCGLKLTKFAITFTFPDHLSREFISDQLEKLKKFLKTQSDTIVNLKIYIGFCEYDDKFTYMPPLPKLKVLEIGNHKDLCLSYHRMNFPTIHLPLILPNLKEIIIYFNYNFCHLNELFTGSLESVEKVRFKFLHLDQNSFSYEGLETLFPSVVDFEVDYLCNLFYHEELSQQYENIPWENTLKKLTIHPHTLNNLKLDSFTRLKELCRLEITKKASTWEQERYAIFDIEGLLKTNVKSIKIQNYLINKKQRKKIQNRFTLDYIPNPNKFKRHG